MGTLAADFVSVSECQSCSDADVDEIKPQLPCYQKRRVTNSGFSFSAAENHIFMRIEK